MIGRSARVIRVCSNTHSKANIDFVQRKYFSNMDFEMIIIQLLAYKKLILKSIVYISLLIVFINCYLIDETLTYCKGSTTLSSQTQKVESLQAPYITLCFQPPFKPSILKNLGVTNINVIKDFYTWEFFQNLSYKHEEDFEIKLKKRANFKNGTGDVTAIKFGMQTIATYRNGLCYLINYTENVSIKHEKIELHYYPKGPKSDLPNSVNIFLSSPNNWHGIIVDDWPLSEPTMFKLPIEYLNATSGIAKVSQTDYHFISGAEKFEHCIMYEAARESGCNNHCFPILFNFLPSYPPCKSTKD